MPKANADFVSSPAKVDPAQSLSDSAIIQGCVAGEQAAWRELVRRYSGLVYSVPLRLGLDEQSAEDVLQMVFEVLLKQLPKLRDARTLPKWLLTAAQRISWKCIKKSNRHVNTTVADQAIDPTDELIQWERRVLIRTALEQLGGRCQELLTALYLGKSETSYEQAARDLGLPLGSIGPTRARCIEKLIQLVSDELDE